MLPAVSWTSGGCVMVTGWIACHNGSLVPYQSGEDYLGWRNL